MKIAIVTGASSGIGKETALLLSQNGYKVYGFNRKKADIPGIEFIPTDLTNTESIAASVAEVIKAEGKIDLLVNNAGMGISGSIENTASENARYIFDVNYFGAFELTKRVLPYMREAGGGRIVNISSLAAVFYLPFQGFYSATKSALCSLFNALQLETRPFNIKITNILPGDIKTGFTDSRRKAVDELPAYQVRMEKSVAVMEKDERNGMPPQSIAQAVLKQATAKRPRLTVVVGFNYKVLAFLAKVLPSGFVNYMIYKIYGG
ncbi:MAG TPA: SDR family NAD(P)-dependent oxidoreductase [Eubacteriales bacterium]|jgi:short-subunit dehydrogenase|nr:SDR family NAD(P)-dependent oxidoreductase [Clostridia bacterium]HRR89558.1 SDR family NAD(P)-dependent oxidoreductase [Eubacteriales bacterium]HRU84323.1 SDR family NAD(P)-dependent oxidoreductase [Eubacteriales bacterium]